MHVGRQGVWASNCVVLNLQMGSNHDKHLFYYNKFALVLIDPQISWMPPNIRLSWKLWYFSVTVYNNNKLTYFMLGILKGSIYWCKNYFLFQYTSSIIYWNESHQGQILNEAQVCKRNFDIQKFTIRLHSDWNLENFINRDNKIMAFFLDSYVLLRTLKCVYIYIYIYELVMLSNET